MLIVSCSKKEACIDDTACNFDSSAEIDDGSCEYVAEYYDCDGNFAMVTVPAGDYTYGENDQTLTIDYDFEMMKYEVTNVQYLIYLEEALLSGDKTVNGNSVTGNYKGDENTGAGDQTFYNLGTPSSYNFAKISYNGSNFQINEPNGISDGEYDNHPVVYVSWYGANAFALHYAMKLPTEYEWEKTARGNIGADYPWGENYGAAINDNANYWE